MKDQKILEIAKQHGFVGEQTENAILLFAGDLLAAAAAPAADDAPEGYCRWCGTWHDTGCRTK